MMNNDDFDKHFNETTKMVRAGMKVAVFVWLAAGLVGLSLLGGAVYVAVHFLNKVW
jgi:hypothetical protein